MTKTEAIKKVKEVVSEILSTEEKKVGVNTDQAAAIYDALMSANETELKNGGTVLVPGGILQLKTSPARKGINPRTGEPLDIAERRRLAVRTTAAGKRAYNG